MTLARCLKDRDGRPLLEFPKLHELLVDEQLDATGGGWRAADAEYLQIVHTKISGIVPLEVRAPRR